MYANILNSLYSVCKQHIYDVILQFVVLVFIRVAVCIGKVLRKTRTVFLKKIILCKYLIYTCAIVRYVIIYIRFVGMCLSIKFLTTYLLVPIDNITCTACVGKVPRKYLGPFIHSWDVTHTLNYKEINFQRVRTTSCQHSLYATVLYITVQV